MKTRQITDRLVIPVCDEPPKVSKTAEFINKWEELTNILEESGADLSKIRITTKG